MDVNSIVPSPTGLEARSEWLVLQSVQERVIDRDQAKRAGFTERQIAHRLHTGRWQRVYPGVYATFSGPVSRSARLWAAVRWAGEGAMVSHETAAELHGILDKPLGSQIHITVPRRRRPGQPRPAMGIVIHRSDQSRTQFSGPFKLPRTRIEDTVLDLVAVAPTFDRAYAWIARAIFRNLVTAGALRAAAAERHRIRWRTWLNDALADARDGVQSPLELHYARDVERAHGLPRSQRQARRNLGGKVHYKDNWYPEYRVAVEIDGPAYHRDEQVQRDRDRDNANLAVDDVKTFRFGPVAVTERACETAAMVAATLQRNGWRGLPHPCRRSGCTVGRLAARPGAS